MKEKRVFTVAIANMPYRISDFINPKIMRDANKAVEFVQRQEGFIGIHPEPPRGTLCLFATENQAKRARNAMESAGIKCGTNICEVFIPDMEEE